MNQTPDARLRILLAAELMGFVFNISALRDLYAHRLAQEVDEPAAEQMIDARRKYWRTRVLCVALAIGTLGYFIRANFAIGSLLMYTGLLVIALHLNSPWIAKPGGVAKHLFGLKKEEQKDV